MTPRPIRPRAAARLAVIVFSFAFLQAIPVHGGTPATPRAPGDVLAIPADEGTDGPVPDSVIEMPARSRPLRALPARGTGPLTSSIYSTNDSLTLFLDSFDDPNGGCHPSGWTGVDLTTGVYAHVSDRFLLNGQSLLGGGTINMGTKALWFGADSASAPDVVKDWLLGTGYGPYWSHRFESPQFSLAGHPNAILSFDVNLSLFSPAALLTTVTASPNSFFAVQGQLPSGKWTMLTMHYTTPTATATALGLRNTGVFHGSVALGADGNDGVGLGPDTKLRIVVQAGNSMGAEGSLTLLMGAVVDNVTLQEGGTDVIAPVDFEDGGIGGWSLGALHGRAFRPSAGLIFTRDVPPLGTMPQPRAGIDANDPTCVWSFLSPGDTLAKGVCFRIVSPYVRYHANSGGGPVFRYSLKYPVASSHGFTTVRARWKYAGSTRVNFLRSQPFQFFGAGTSDLDASYTWLDDDYSFFSLAVPASAPLTADSVQFLIEYADQGERFTTDGTIPEHAPTRIPFFDDLSVAFVGADQDFDGVPNDQDGCPTVQAAGQDADGDGCVDATATMRHVEYWPSGQPVTYAISQAGDPANTDGSDIAAIEQGFATWAAVPGTNLNLSEQPLTSRTESSPLDGVNLVTFQDGHTEFPPSVIAVTPTLSFTRRGSYLDRVGLPGQIVDADMVFNRNLQYSTPTHDGGPGSIDLKSVVVHEAGHFFGLAHSGVLDACMFFVLQPGSRGETLSDDDRAAIAAAYPAPSLGTDYGTIRGKVTRGGSGAAIGGALVTAVRLDGVGAPMDSSASDYTAEDGTYALLRLPPGNYYVRLTPLDGAVGGFPLTAAYISARVEAEAVTDFTAEWWDASEGSSDAPDAKDPLTVGAGSVLSNVNIVTDIDATPPQVSNVTPATGASDVRIDGAVVVEFSEPVNANTLQSAFSFRVSGGSGLPGGGQLLNAGRSFVFSPASPLAFGVTYEIGLTTGLRDVQGNALAAPFTSQFHTENRPNVAITAIQPREASAGSLVEVVGVGFGTAPGDVNTVLFPSCAACPPVAVTPATVTASSMVVQVPANAGSGLLQVTSNGDPSNTLGFTLLPPLAQVAPSLTGEFALPAGFAPSDAAIAPDDRTLYAVGAGGIATVNLDASRPDFRVARVTALGGMRHFALSPDGFSAFATRRDSGDVVVVDADPLSGTVRQVRAVIPMGAASAPDGIALSTNGRRAYVTDAYANVVYEVDVDPASPTRYLLLREIHDPAAGISGGVAVSPGSGKLFFTSADAGARQATLADPTPVAGAVNGQACSGGAAVTPSGIELLLAGGGASGASLLWSRLEGPTPVQGSVALGGDVHDVATSPRAPFAFAVNASFNKLQVVDVNPASPDYHRKVSETATGAHPVAVAVGASGSLILVANEGAGSLSLYGTGSVGQITRITPPVASPGDEVAVRLTTGFDPSGVQFDLGAGSFSATRVPSPATPAATFAVPAVFQQQAGLAAIASDASRTLALPFRVVDRIEALAPRPTGLVPGPSAAPCGVGSSVGRMPFTRTSHDGALLAVARERDCDVLLDLYRASAAASGALGDRLTTVTLSTSAGTVRGLDFTPDDRAMWVTLGGDEILRVDADGASPGFGQVTSLATAPGETPGAVCADPLGRYMLVGQGAVTLGLWDPASGTRPATVPLPAAATAIAVAPGGRWALVGHEGRATLADLDAAAVVTGTPFHAGAPSNAVRSIAVTRDGRQAMGLFEQGAVAAWNLDPARGAMGAERWYGVPATAFPLRSLLPAPDGDGVLAGCDSGTDLCKLEPSVVPPGISTAGLGQASRSIADSPDGRLLWVANWDATGTTGDVRAFTLGDATTLALESGGNQLGGVGTVLPVPVRVRLSGADGRPAAGMPVRFRLPSGSGSLDAQGATALRLTDANGEAAVQWTLTGAPGPDQVEIEALGVPGATLQALATAAGDDQLVLPALIEVGPGEGSTNVNVGTSFIVRFDQRIVAASLDTTLSLVNVNGARFGLSLAEGTADGRGAILRVTQPLPFSMSFSLVILPGVVDAEGQKTTLTYTTHFSTQPQPALSLASVSPPSTQLGAPVLLTGEGFSTIPAQNTVLFGSAIAVVQTASAHELWVNVPAGLNYGPHPITVSSGGGVSNAVTFTVPLPPIAGVPVADVPMQPGVSKIAIAPDGRLAYVTNPQNNTVTVARISPPALVANISGLYQPAGITILPDGRRAYVANTGAGTLSMIDLDPHSPTYHKVTGTVDVGGHPMDVAVSGVGPTLVVLDGDTTGTMSFVDARQGNGTYNRVVNTTTTGSGGRSIVISPDGTRGFIVTAGGQMIEVDVRSRQVVSTTSIGSGGKGIVISPDGTVVFVLTTNGQLMVIDVAPSSPTRNRIIATTSVGSSGKAVIISPDGTVAYASNGAIVKVFQVVVSEPGSASTYNPGQRVTLVPLYEQAVAQAPAGVALDPTGQVQIVVDEGTGRIVVLSAGGNIVTPAPSLSACISTAAPCVTVPFTIARTDTSRVRGFSVTFRLSSNLQVCGGASGIVEGSYLNAFPGASTFLQSIHNADDSWSVDGVMLGASCGPADPGGTLFTASLQAAGADGPGSVTVTSFRLRNCDNDSLPATAGSPGTISVRRTLPAAVATLAAAQQTAGNDAGGTTAIVVSWPAVEAGAAVEVYRAGFGHYPEYDDAGGAAPAVPAYPPPAPAWTLAGTVHDGSSLLDHPGTRDSWYYVAFVKDGCGNVSPVSGLTPGTLDYFLGDVADGVSLGAGDNRVNLTDVSSLGASYGITLVAADPLAFLDVGPTTDHTVGGRPLTDDRINFEDLVMFAIDYGVASSPHVAARPDAIARMGEVRLDVPDRVVAGEPFDVAVHAGGLEGVQAFSLQLAWDPGVVEPVSIDAGSLVRAARGIVLSARGGNVDGAALGAGNGMAGEGTLATVRFRARVTGAPGVTLASLEARDGGNRSVAIGAPAVPGATALSRPLPNPSSGTSSVSFALARKGAVELAVYGVDGRRVKTLLKGTLEPGFYGATWDGTDASGARAGAGVFFVRLVAPGARMSYKVVRLR